MTNAGWRFRWLRRRLREGIRDNTWLLPLAGGIAGIVLARLVSSSGIADDTRWTVTVDRGRDSFAGALVLVFTALSIVFALASVAAQNIVSRFGSRTLRVYLRHSVDKWVLGMFALTAFFILAEQVQLRKLEPDAPAPVAGLIVSLVLVVVTSAMLLWYVGSLVRWLRVGKALSALRKATLESARSIARTGRTGPTPVSIPERPAAASDLRASHSGHLAEIDAAELLELCRPLDAVAVITEPLGSAVLQNQPIGWIAGRESKFESLPERQIADAIDVSGSRELAQNLEYSIVAMVDIAIIALSPAVNDPNTAVEVIEEMSFLFHELDPPTLGPYADPDGDAWPRVVVRARTFGELVELATTQIVLYGASDPMVLRALRRFAHSLQLLDLDLGDRRHVDEFAAKLDAPTTT